MPKPRPVTCRLSRFSSEWREVQVDPAAVLRTARARLGKPEIQRFPDALCYVFPHNLFDSVSFRVPRRST